jgi:hypothetical protein
MLVRFVLYCDVYNMLFDVLKCGVTAVCVEQTTMTTTAGLAPLL